MDAATLTLDDLATLLRKRPDTLRKSWSRLNREFGFPRPLPGLGLLWSRALVIAWIDAGGVTPAPAREIGTAYVDRVHASLKSTYVESPAHETRQAEHPSRFVA